MSDKTVKLLVSITISSEPADLETALTNQLAETVTEWLMEASTLLEKSGNGSIKGFSITKQ